MFPDCYPELNDTQRLIRDTIRKVAERELKPHVHAMENGDSLPYPHVRKFVASLGMGGGGELTEAKFVPGLQDGSLIGSWCLTEPGAGSDAFGSMQTRARKDGDQFVLNGAKTFITNAPFADVFIVYAKVEGNGGGREIQPFLLERGTPGLDTSKPFKKMGTHSSPTGAVYLEEVRIPQSNLIGGGVRDRDHVKSRLGDERAGMPTLSLGLADRAFELAMRYSRERKQFGKPIAEFQLQCCEAATQITHEAIHILGGNGYMEEYEVERLARDAKLMERGGGTTEIQELTIARNLVQQASA